MDKSIVCFKVMVMVALAAVLVACAGGNKSGYVPADKVGPLIAPVEAQDLISCAEELARDLMETPEVAAATPYCRIALREIDNHSDFEFDTGIITSDIRHILMRYGRDHIRFVERNLGGDAAMPTSDVLDERELKNEGFFDLSKEAPLAGVDFFLRGEIRSHTVAGRRLRDDTIWYYCWLVDAETGELIWEHRYGPIRKVSDR